MFLISCSALLSFGNSAIYKCIFNNNDNNNIKFYYIFHEQSVEISFKKIV